MGGAMGRRARVERIEAGAGQAGQDRMQRGGALEVKDAPARLRNTLRVASVRARELSAA
jgi:hypothetical protein